MDVFTVLPGDSPVVLAQPHGGIFVPEDLNNRLNSRGRGLDDTDWHITRLYEGLLPSATVVKSNVHRYVIDANRDPAGHSLYPGQNTTTLCPLTDFDGADIWESGQQPSPDEIESRRQSFHAPYHAALAQELARVHAKHGIAVLFDCHSIRSTIPFLFDGELPIYNVGTNLGQTCDPEIERLTHQTCLTAQPDSTILNGRFKGGWTTRHYGQPQNHYHAIQMETSQRAYMDETAPWTFRPEKAAQPRAVLQDILTKLDQFARSRAAAT